MLCVVVYVFWCLLFVVVCCELFVCCCGRLSFVVCGLLFVRGSFFSGLSVVGCSLL